MKKITLLFFTLGIFSLLHAQTVENIRVEPDGDNIKINYRIGGSTDAQLYNVVLTCSMDGGPRFEPKTVIGDVGENIRGGRSFYTVVWDVFEDIEEVGNAEFFVKVELVSDMSPTIPQRQVQPQNQPQRQPENQPAVIEERTPSPFEQDFELDKSVKKEIEWKAYLAYSGSTSSPIGLSFGTLKKTGVYGSFRYGSYISDYETDVWITFMAGLTKYIVESGKYRLHAYGGAGVTVEVYEEYYNYTSWTDSFLSIDAGLINAIGRLNVNLGIEFIRYFGTYPTFGLGFVF